MPHSSVQSWNKIVLPSWRCHGPTGWECQRAPSSRASNGSCAAIRQRATRAWLASLSQHCPRIGCTKHGQPSPTPDTAGASASLVAERAPTGWHNEAVGAWPKCGVPPSPATSFDNQSPDPESAPPCSIAMPVTESSPLRGASSSKGFLSQIALDAKISRNAFVNLSSCAACSNPPGEAHVMAAVTHAA